MMDQTINKDREQLSKNIKPPLYSLEHRVKRKKSQVGEALKTQIKLT
jgi:hypothetical protein